MDKHYFLLRRLHSLTGLVPIGVFLVAHLTTNSSILWGAFNARAGDDALDRRVTTFQEEVSWINGMPFLLLIELSLWGAIAFHTVLGFYYASTGKHNLQRYSYQDNWRYSLQRISGYLAFVFIFYHVATLRWGWTFLVPGGTSWTHHFAGSTAAAAIQGSPDGITLGGAIVTLGYFVGITASVFHFANGLWTSAITWGLTVTEQAQKRWGVACAAIGTGLMLAAWGSLYGFATLDPREAAEIEYLYHEAHGKDVHEKPFEPRDEGMADAASVADQGSDSEGSHE